MLQSPRRERGFYRKVYIDVAQTKMYTKTCSQGATVTEDDGMCTRPSHCFCVVGQKRDSCLGEIHGSAGEQWRNVETLKLQISLDTEVFLLPSKLKMRVEASTSKLSKMSLRYASLAVKLTNDDEFSVKDII